MVTGLLLATALAGPALAAPVAAPSFGGWVADWHDDILQLKKHARDINSICLFYYGESATGEVTSAGQPEDPALIAWAQAHGIEVWATIGGTPPTLPAAYEGAAAGRLIAGLVAKAEQFNFDGIDLDLEGIDKVSRTEFTAFVARLAGALHLMKRPRKLSVTVQDFPSAEDESSMAFDYVALGAAADLVRVMLYDYSTDNPGSIMPHDWYSNDVKFAASHLPRGKFIAALPWYGRNWVPADKEHEDLEWTRTVTMGVEGIQPLMDRLKITPKWDEAGGEITFTYTESGKLHEVWAADDRSFAWQAAEALQAGAAGIYVWNLAYPHPGYWRTVRKIRGRK